MGIRGAQTVRDMPEDFAEMVENHTSPGWGGLQHIVLLQSNEFRRIDFFCSSSAGIILLRITRDDQNLYR